jgi:hypothetical protein
LFISGLRVVVSARDPVFRLPGVVDLFCRVVDGRVADRFWGAWVAALVCVRVVDRRSASPPHARRPINATPTSKLLGIGLSGRMMSAPNIRPPLDGAPADPKFSPGARLAPGV